MQPEGQAQELPSLGGSPSAYSELTDGTVPEEAYQGLGTRVLESAESQVESHLCLLL